MEVPIKQLTKQKWSTQLRFFGVSTEDTLRQSQFSLTLIVDTGKMCQICKDHFSWKVLGPHRHYPAVLTVAGVESVTNDSLRWLTKRTSPMWLSENGILIKQNSPQMVRIYIYRDDDVTMTINEFGGVRIICRQTHDCYILFLARHGDGSRR